MSKNSFTEEDAKEFIRNLSYKEFSEIVKEYSNKNGRDFSNEMRKLSIADLQARLEELGINNDCPECCDNENVINTKHHLKAR